MQNKIPPKIKTPEEEQVFKTKFYIFVAIFCLMFLTLLYSASKKRQADSIEKEAVPEKAVVVSPAEGLGPEEASPGITTEESPVAPEENQPADFQEGIQPQQEDIQLQQENIQPEQESIQLQDENTPGSLDYPQDTYEEIEIPE